MPILLVRRQDGSLGAYLNVCRHRGARVAEGCGNAKLFVCPYHAWSYDTEGKLRGRPDDRSFAGFDKEGIGLRALPVMEKHGMIFVASAPGATIDVDPLLGGLQHDLAEFRLETYHHYETRALTRKLNWKIVVDTFLETYHLQYLHTNTVSPILHSNTTTFDAFGPSLRMVAARRTIDKLRAIPPEQWNVIPLIAGIYVLFPNTVFIMQGDHVETWHVYPSGDGVNEFDDARVLLHARAAGVGQGEAALGQEFQSVDGDRRGRGFSPCGRHPARLPLPGAGGHSFRAQRAGPAALPQIGEARAWHALRMSLRPRNDSEDFTPPCRHRD